MECIWCGKQSTGPVHEEHIIPESLGCPSGLVFRGGEVCQKCNNRLARLDQALISEFEFHRFMAGVRNKKGELPKISTLGYIRGYYTQTGPRIDFNLGQTPAGGNIEGQGLSPYRPGPRGIHVQCRLEADGTAHMHFHQEGFCNSKQVVRAICKIAFSAFAQQNPDRATASEYDSVREYVLRGCQERVIPIIPGWESGYRTGVWLNNGSTFPDDVVFVLMPRTGFFVDLSKGQVSLPKIRSFLTAQLGLNGWTWVPIEDGANVPGR